MNICDYNVCQEIRVNVYDCSEEVEDRIVEELESLCECEGIWEVYKVNADGSTMIRGAIYGDAESVEITDGYWGDEYDFEVDIPDIEWVLNDMGVKYNIEEGDIEANTSWKYYGEY